MEDPVQPVRPRTSFSGEPVSPGELHSMHDLGAQMQGDEEGELQVTGNNSLDSDDSVPLTQTIDRNSRNFEQVSGAEHALTNGGSDVKSTDLVFVLQTDEANAGIGAWRFVTGG